MTDGNTLRYLVGEFADIPPICGVTIISTRRSNIRPWRLSVFHKNYAPNWIGEGNGAVKHDGF
jgi:hypothetical protein